MAGGQRDRKFYQNHGSAGKTGTGSHGRSEHWFQGLIAAALSIGISKRELLNDYYMDEIGPIFEEWNRLHDPDREETEEVEAADFLGGEGEWLE